MTRALKNHQFNPITSLSHSSIRLFHKHLRESDGNHLIAATVTNQDPPSPNLGRQVGNFLRRLAVAAGRNSLQNETLACEGLVVLPLRQFLCAVSVGVGGEDSFHVGHFEELGGEEAGAGAGYCCVKGTRDENFEPFLKVLEEALVSSQFLKARVFWLG